MEGKERDPGALEETGKVRYTFDSRQTLSFKGRVNVWVRLDDLNVSLPVKENLITMSDLSVKKGQGFVLRTLRDSGVVGGFEPRTQRMRTSLDLSSHP